MSPRSASMRRSSSPVEREAAHLVLARAAGRAFEARIDEIEIEDGGADVAGARRRRQGEARAEQGQGKERVPAGAAAALSWSSPPAVSSMRIQLAAHYAARRRASQAAGGSRSR